MQMMKSLYAKWLNQFSESDIFSTHFYWSRNENASWVVGLWLSCSYLQDSHNSWLCDNYCVVLFVLIFSWNALKCHGWVEKCTRATENGCKQNILFLFSSTFFPVVPPTSITSGQCWGKCCKHFDHWQYKVLLLTSHVHWCRNPKHTSKSKIENNRYFSPLYYW